MLPVRFALPLLMAAVCVAQEAQPQPQQPVRPAAPIVSMKFDGGTMVAFVKAIQRVEPKANIILAEAAGAAVVPAMEIEEAGLDQILECACAAAKGPQRIDCMEKRGIGVPVYTIVALDRKTMSRGAVDPRDEVQTTVLSLNRLTGGYPERQVPGLKVETVLSAIEVGSTFDGEPPSMRFHQDSGLLFLHGTRDQLSLAMQVLQILENDLKERAAMAQPERFKDAFNKQDQRGDAGKRDR